MSSLTVPQCPKPRIRAHIRVRYWSAKIDDIFSLRPPGRDQWERWELGKVKNIRYCSRIVVIAVILYHLGKYIFPFPLSPPEWIGDVQPNRRGADNFQPHFSFWFSGCSTKNYGRFSKPSVLLSDVVFFHRTVYCQSAPKWQCTVHIKHGEHIFPGHYWCC